MPFTPAHPAVVLPFLNRKRHWFSNTGLIIGSMAPDFEYFFRLDQVSLFSHSILGVFLFNVPVALLLSLVFHVLVRDHVTRHLPPYFRQRALAVPSLDWVAYLQKNWFLFSVSAAIGAFSHLLWDQFTHQDFYLVNKIPILLMQVKLPLLDRHMLLCRLVQHSSSVLGLLAVLWYVHRLPKATVQPVQQLQWFDFWMDVFGFGFLFLLLNLFTRMDLFPAPGNLIVILLSGCMLALTVTGTAAKLRCWCRVTRQTHHP